MSTVVSVKNRSKTNFKATTVVFSELETRLDEFWHSKVTDSVIECEQKVVFGKIIHPSELKSGANFIVTLLLTIHSSDAPEPGSKQNFISLKARLKGTKTGATVYACVSSFPESANITTPLWRKGGDKHNSLCKISDKLFIIIYTGCWNDNITFHIEEVNSLPVFMKLKRDCKEKEHIDEIYENEWRQHTIGAVKYSHAHTNVLEKRPVFSTINGNSVPAMNQYMLPCPWWVWLDEWHVDKSIATPDGWLYLDNWYSEENSQPESTKLRMRRWIRKRLFVKDSPKMLTEFEKRLLKEFKDNNSNEIYSILNDSMPPFLKELQRDVLLNTEHYDFSGIAAIPSPKLRRIIKA